MADTSQGIPHHEKKARKAHKRDERDSNPRHGNPVNRISNPRVQPLRHLSGREETSIVTTPEACVNLLAALPRQRWPRPPPVGSGRCTADFNSMFSAASMAWPRALVRPSESSTGSGGATTLGKITLGLGVTAQEHKNNCKREQSHHGSNFRISSRPLLMSSNENRRTFRTVNYAKNRDKTSERT